MSENPKALLVINMRRYCFLLVAVLTACAYAGDGEESLRSLQGMQGLRIICNNEEKLSVVRSYEGHPDFDFLKMTRSFDSPIEVLVTADAVENFKTVLANNGIAYKIFDHNVADNIRKDYIVNEIARNMHRSPKASSPFNYYPRFNEMATYLKELAESNKAVTLVNVGTSYEGRTIYGVKISSGAGNNKPAILMDAGIHAREWIAPTTALYAIHQLVTNKTNSVLYENVDWYIIPSLNPDGYEYTHQKYRLWRKTRSVNKGTNCYGTDPNRNFELEWMTVGASADPCSEIYAGSKPFSEPETAALRDFVLANNESIKLYLTLHSFGQYFLHPWGFTSASPNNEPILRTVAVKAEKALASVHGMRYTIGSSYSLYPVSGSSIDWVMGTGGVPLSYTIELPSGGAYGFNPPPSIIAPVGEETFEAFRVFAEYVRATYA